MLFDFAPNNITEVKGVTKIKPARSEPPWRLVSAISNEGTSGFQQLKNLYIAGHRVFTTRCYASAVLVLAMGLCLSVCLSVTSRCSIETAERIELGFGM